MPRLFLFSGVMQRADRGVMGQCEGELIRGEHTQIERAGECMGTVMELSYRVLNTGRTGMVLVQCARVSGWSQDCIGSETGFLRRMCVHEQKKT